MKRLFILAVSAGLALSASVASADVIDNTEVCIVTEDLSLEAAGDDVVITTVAMEKGSVVCNHSVSTEWNVIKQETADYVFIPNENKNLNLLERYQHYRTGKSQEALTSDNYSATAINHSENRRARDGLSHA